MPRPVASTAVTTTATAASQAVIDTVVADSPCYYAKHAEAFLKPRKRRVHGILGIAKQLRILYKPLGVVGQVNGKKGMRISCG